MAEQDKAALEATVHALTADLRRARAGGDAMRARMAQWKDALALKIADLDEFQASLEPA